MSLYYVTGNKGKYLAVKKKCESKNIPLEYKNIDIDELEVSDVEKVSLDKAIKSYNKIGYPCFVEDSGFYIDGYPNKKNYPGTMVKRSGISNNIEYLLETMKNIKNRNCHFVSCVTYYDGDFYIQFTSYSSGILSYEKKGILPENARSRLWEVFIPENYNKTLAEMTEEEREERSNNRTSSFDMFISWYEENILQKDKVSVKK